jgi:molybdopterin-guanine dinucleotide biosynthesis protein A
MLWTIESHEAERARKNARFTNQWRRECEWHPWFAWYPVRITPTTRAWLTRVERRLDYIERRVQPQWYHWYIREFEYRPAQ